MVETNRLLEFAWVSQGTLGKESIVRVDFEAVAGGTRVNLTTGAFPTRRPDQSMRPAGPGFSNGWRTG